MLSSLLSSPRRGQGLPVTVHVPAPTGAPASGSHQAAELTRIAQAAVNLAALGPQLAALAANVEQQAQLQAKRAAAIATTTEALTQDLDRAVQELRSSTGEMHAALKAVERIAEHTRIVSLNASIEAARAGAAGRAFAVVVDEVKRLADDSAQNTQLVEQRMANIATSVADVAAVTVQDTRATAATDARTVAAVNHQVHGMAESAGAQLQSAASVHGLGDRINALTESLLLAVGTFRFEAHARAEAAVRPLLPILTAAMDDRARLEAALERWLGEHHVFELAYVTDAAGRQIVDNLACRDGRVVHDRGGFGRDWSERPWFREARAHSGVCATDLYRSTATAGFCFTIAVTLRDARGQAIGVFGSDVNFQRLVSA